jgi:hypothetical protein
VAFDKIRCEKLLRLRVSLTIEYQTEKIIVKLFFENDSMINKIHAFEFGLDRLLAAKNVYQ